jgi:hypothetical protein
MGAHMGYGGVVKGETLRCPFHGFCFNPTGACVSTPYGKRLPHARARVRPVIERNGVVLTWHDPARREPLWDIPELPSDDYGRLYTRLFRSLRTHPQETTENGVDIGHFAIVHGYEGVTMDSPLELNGPHLSARYTFRRKDPFLPWLTPAEVHFEVSVHGLGYSFVQVEIPARGISSRHFVLATPVDAEHIALRIALCLRVPKPAQVSSALAILPGPLARALLGELMLRSYAHDLTQDFHVWENKMYVQRPALAEGDGPVGRYRTWCRQFYPTSLPVCT